MGTVEFADFQEAFLYAVGPWLGWLLAFLAAAGFIAGVLVMWLFLLRYLTRNR